MFSQKCTSAQRRRRGGSSPRLSAPGTSRPAPAPAAAPGAARTLVERFDIEPYSDFSAKRARFTGLVLFCIDADFCK